MKKETFGSLVAGVIAAMISTAAVAGETAGTQATTTQKTDTPAAKGEMVKCYSDSCAGKFGYKGEQNTCAGKSHAMEVPKNICDPKKGLKIASK